DDPALFYPCHPGPGNAPAAAMAEEALEQGVYADPERVHLAGLRKDFTDPAEVLAVRIAGFRADQVRKPHFSTQMSGSQRRARPSPRARAISDALHRSLITLVI